MGIRGYFSSTDGKLFVIVDDGLDCSAPWPRAFDDWMNTKHVEPQP
jgi:hypothetical protein